MPVPLPRAEILFLLLACAAIVSLPTAVVAQRQGPPPQRTPATPSVPTNAVASGPTPTQGGAAGAASVPGAQKTPPGSISSQAVPAPPAGPGEVDDDDAHAHEHGLREALMQGLFEAPHEAQAMLQEDVVKPLAEIANQVDVQALQAAARAELQEHVINPMQGIAATVSDAEMFFRARALAGRLAHSMNVTIGSAAEALAGEMREHLGVEPGGLARELGADLSGFADGLIKQVDANVREGLTLAASGVARAQSQMHDVSNSVQSGLAAMMPGAPDAVARFAARLKRCAARRPARIARAPVLRRGPKRTPRAVTACGVGHTACPISTG